MDTIGSNPLSQGSARRRGLYLLNIQYSKQTNIHAPVGIEPATPASELADAYAIDRAATKSIL